MTARSSITGKNERLRRYGTTGLLLFLGVVFLMGGGSRSDIASLAILRLVAACTLAWAILMVSRQDLERIRVPLGLLIAIACIAAMQLVPLPPQLWTALPGRDVIARLDVLTGLEAWRPISLSPFKTANSLASLVVPLTALLLFAKARDTNTILFGFVAFGVVSGLMGILQLFGDPRSGLYLYAVTNPGSAVGLFANRNHHSVFLACCVLISLYLARQSRAEATKLQQWGLAGSALFMSLAIIANISRAGLLALFLVAALSAIAAALARFRLPAKDQIDGAAKRYVLPFALGIAGALILALFAFAERSPALSRILAGGDVEDLRDSLLPHLLRMTIEFQPLGTGLGAFEYAYRMQEPYELLGPSYLNHAHNEWLQFPIEGGLAAVLVMAAGVAFTVTRLVQLVRAPRIADKRIDECWLGFGLLVVLGTASLVDYPLRVPSIMTLTIIALAMFARPALKVGR